MENKTTLRVERDESGTALKIAGVLRIHSADELRVALEDFIRTTSVPVVDLSGVTQCDTAGLQLLCSAVRTAGGMGKSLGLQAASAAVRDGADALGLRLEPLPVAAASVPESLQL